MFKSLQITLVSFFLWLLTFINLALIVFAGIFFVTFYKSQAPSSVASAPLSENTANSELDVDALNAYGVAVARAGLMDCAEPMNDLTERLLAGKKIGIYRFPVVDNNFVSLSAEVAVEGGATIYMTFNVAQNDHGSCQIAYESISDWANSCEEVATTVFPDFIPTRKLLNRVVLLRHAANDNRKVFTMPVESGCVALEKEVVYTSKS